MSEPLARPLSPLVRAWRVAFVRVEDRRLGAALMVARHELVPMLRRLGDPSRRDDIGAGVEALLARAEGARAAGQVDEGWECLNAAQRLAIFGTTDAEAAAIATALREEADKKLGGWRRKAVLAQLQGPGGAPSIDRFRLHAALQLRDDHHQNAYYRTRLAARQFKTIALYIGVALVGMLAVHRLGAPFPGSAAPTDAAHLLPWTALFGLLGATFSVAFPLTRGTADGRRIPEQVGSQAITLVRPLLGAAAGPVAFAFVRSGLFSASVASEPTLLLVAFAAGFSERLILRAVSAVSGDGAAGRDEPREDLPKPRHRDAPRAASGEPLGTPATIPAETAELPVPPRGVAAPR